MDLDGNIAFQLAEIEAGKSVRQLAEWGMHGFQSSFLRLYDRFRYEENGERKIMIGCLIYLFNYRASTVGFNQIKTVFMPHLIHANFLE